MNRKLQLIRRYFTGAKKYFVAAIFASVFMTILNSLTPQIFRFTIDSVLGSTKYPQLKENLWIMALLIIITALLSGIFMFICRYFTAKAGENFAENMRKALFAHVQKLPMSWHDKNQTGDIIQRCTSDVEVIRNFVVTQLLEVFRTIFLVAVSFGMMWTMNRKLSLIVLAFVPFVIAYSGIFYRLIARRFTDADEAEGALSTVVQEHKQQLVFQGRQINLLAVTGNRAFVGIHRQISQRDSTLSLPGPAKHAADPGNQFPGTEWLGDVIIGAHIQSGHHAEFITGRSQEDHRNAQLLCVGTDGKAVSLSQRDIYQSKLRPVCFHCFGSRFLPGNRCDLEVFSCKKAGEHPNQSRVILHQKQLLHSHTSSFSYIIAFLCANYHY